MSQMINLGLVTLLCFFLILFAGTSIREREFRAAKRSLGVLAGMLLLDFGILYLPDGINQCLSGLFVISLILLWVLTFLPIGQSVEKPGRPGQRVDERDIPFSRIRLIPGSRPYRAYYKMRPENLAVDEQIRTLPGLLSSEAKLVHPIGFPAADASFDFIETFRSRVEQEAEAKFPPLPPIAMSHHIKQLGRYYGAHSVGITRLESYHIYTHIGRGSGRYGAPIELPHRYAIAFTVEMNHRMIRSAPQAPAVMETGKQYVEAARVAMQLMLFIRKVGGSARAHIDGNYRVIAPLVARDAGLGEIGRMGILMTSDLGPRVRLGVVTTDLPLQTDSYNPDGAMIDFCRVCKKCAENCPGKAIPFGDRTMIDGTLRWQIDGIGCFRYWNVVGTDCGRCMAVCPYSHPDSLIHNTVRSFILRSGFTRRIALFLDDLFYGRKPEKFPLPSWMDQTTTPATKTR